MATWGFALVQEHVHFVSMIFIYDGGKWCGFKAHGSCPNRWSCPMSKWTRLGCYITRLHVSAPYSNAVLQMLGVPYICTTQGTNCRDFSLCICTFISCIWSGNSTIVPSRVTFNCQFFLQDYISSKKQRMWLTLIVISCQKIRALYVYCVAVIVTC